MPLMAVVLRKATRLRIYKIKHRNYINTGSKCIFRNFEENRCPRPGRDDVRLQTGRALPLPLAEAPGRPLRLHPEARIAGERFLTLHDKYWGAGRNSI